MQAPKMPHFKTSLTTNRLSMKQKFQRMVLVLLDDRMSAPSIVEPEFECEKNFMDNHLKPFWFSGLKEFHLQFLAKGNIWPTHEAQITLNNWNFENDACLYCPGKFLTNFDNKIHHYLSRGHLQKLAALLHPDDTEFLAKIQNFNEKENNLMTEMNRPETTKRACEANSQEKKRSAELVEQKANLGIHLTPNEINQLNKKYKLGPFIELPVPTPMESSGFGLKTANDVFLEYQELNALYQKVSTGVVSESKKTARELAQRERKEMAESYVAKMRETEARALVDAHFPEGLDEDKMARRLKWCYIEERLEEITPLENFELDYDYIEDDKQKSH